MGPMSMAGPAGENRRKTLRDSEGRVPEVEAARGLDGIRGEINDCERIRTGVPRIHRLSKPRGDMTGNQSKDSALHRAAARGDLEEVRALLDGSADPGDKDQDKVTALHHAARAGHADIAALLLSRGADPDAVDRYGRTALWLAAAGGRVRTVRVLLEGGAAVDVDSLACAHDNGDRRVLLLLHDYGVRAAIRKNDSENLEVLLRDGASELARDADLKTPLHLAAACGSIDAARVLLGHGADADARDRGMETPLHEAAGRGNSEVVDLLLQKGADASALDASGMTAEHFARTMGHHALAVRLAKVIASGTRGR